MLVYDAEDIRYLDQTDEPKKQAESDEGKSPLNVQRHESSDMGEAPKSAETVILPSSYCGLAMMSGVMQVLLLRDCPCSLLPPPVGRSPRPIILTRQETGRVAGSPRLSYSTSDTVGQWRL